MKRPVKQHYTHRDLPETEYHRTIKESGDDPITMWLEDFVMSRPRDETEYKLSSEEAWESFRIYCSDANLTNKLNNLALPLFGHAVRGRWRVLAFAMLFTYIHTYKL